MIVILLALLLVLSPPPSYALIDAKNANFTDTWVDMNLTGTGYELRIQRTYNSRSLFNGLFGFGMCTDFETRLEVTAENTLTLTECGAGLRIDYIPKGFDKKQVKKTATKIVAGIKKKNPSLNIDYLTKLEKDLLKDDRLRSRYTSYLKFNGKAKEGLIYYAMSRENENITFKSNKYFRKVGNGSFQVFNKKGQLIKMSDKNGNYLKIKYSGTIIKFVADNNGRKLNFNYNDIKKVASVIGPKGLKAKYYYKGEDLIRVDAGKKRKSSYEYDDLHNLTKITFPDKTFKKLTYNKDRDWITEFQDQRGCVEKYVYNSDKSNPLYQVTSIIKTCNKKITNQSSFEFYHKKYRNAPGNYLWRARSDNNGKITDVIYHEVFGKPISIVQDRYRTDFAFFKNGLVKKKIENNKETLFSYSPSCLKVSKVTVSYFKLDPPKKKKKARKTASRGKSREVFKTLWTKFKYTKAKCNLYFAKNSEGQVANLKYDRFGRIAEIKDQSRKIVKIKYNNLFGKPRLVSRPGLGSIEVKYKKNGEIDKVKSKDGPTVAVQVASIFNNLLEIISPATTDLSL